MNRFLKYRFFWLVCIILTAILLSSRATINQVDNANIITPPDTADTLKLKYPIKTEDGFPFSNSDQQSGLYLNNPSNINDSIYYNPETGEYEFSEKIGQLNYRNPVSMSLEEYRNYDFETGIKNYWKQRSKSEASDYQSQLIPKLHIGSEVFEKIFGTNTIDIKPQGSAELIFGLQISKIDNPTLPEKLRRTTTFDFQEKIQMNVTGQIGDKLKLSTNYNTEATFDFENKMNLAYEGKEDEIIQKIEAGNVTLPLTGSLITGSQSLFGIKSELKFGKLSVALLLSQQKGKTSQIEVQGGAQTSNYEVYADDYEANKHFFLSQYFYDNYEPALKNLPVINSGINITKIEVWVTNKSGNYQDSRNVVAFMDLAEGPDHIYNTSQVSVNYGYPYTYPSDTANSLAGIDFLYPGIRDISQISSLLSPPPPLVRFVAGTDYEKLENARMLTSSEYTLNTKLGFISLNSALNSDEILAVAYEYTVGGKTFRVGEFSNSGIASPKVLIVKLIKGTALTPHLPTWKLMMKNVYAIGAYQVNSEDFKLDVYYRNDKTGSAVQNIPAGAISGKKLLTVLNLDKLNSNGDPYPDGVFDFIDKVTINASNGRVFFPVLEPFGKYLFDAIVGTDLSEASTSTAKDYVFRELYDSTQSKARQIAEKNKFFLKGTYKSASGSDISLNAVNVPQGSVKVTAGGMQLVENQDYTVDYTLGKVKIINQGLLQSGTPIKISLESNSMFSIQSKTLLGTHLDYKFNNDFRMGATVLRLTERPLTQKVNIGDEPISNTIWGFDGSYKSDVPLLTRLIDKIPFLDTKEMSNIMITGEFAHLIPGHSRAIAKEGISYIDDFEGSKTSIDVKSFNAWSLASTPQGQSDLFKEGGLNDSLPFGFNRAKIAWYVIDPLFFQDNSATPGHLTDADLNNHFVRQVFETEIFPNKEPQNGIVPPIPVLNLAFYPSERGPYNFDVSPTPFSAGIDALGNLLNPASRWGGIIRKLETNDFEASNIEFIEFWMMDPFVYDTTANGGQLYFNLGNISEDVLRDSRKAFENGLPTSADITMVDTTSWGRVPLVQSLVNAFDNNPGSRQYQDVGLDGLSDADERTFYNGNVENFLNLIADTFGTGSSAYQQSFTDPSSDNYHYFRGGDYDGSSLGILDRYKMYNGLERNSPTSEQSPEQYSTSATTQPNTEDINRDNTLSESESYFQYKVDLSPGRLQVGQNFVTDQIVGTNKDGEQVTWYQFKIPINSPGKVVGSIEDFKSIRFMRIFMKGFDRMTVLRFAKLDLVRGEWRKYNGDLLEPGLYEVGPTASTSFDVSAVNIEENGKKTPVNYVLPPDITRVIDPTNPQLRQLNEQAILLKVCDLMDGDARAAYKNVDMDVRQYKRLQMDIHAEAMPGQPLNNYDVSAFIRLGSDYQNNYYEYEIPLALTSPGYYDNASDEDRELVWPAENKLDIAFEIFQAIKQQRNNEMRATGSMITLSKVYSTYDGKNKVSVCGNPNLSNVRTIMIGIRNRLKQHNPIADDNLPKCAEVWMNELRLTDFDEKGGWAANARISAKLADFGTLTVAGSTSKPGFGSIEKKVNERSKEEMYQYDIASNLELGKFFPEKTGIKIPMFVGYSEGFINPQYNPLDPDIPLKVTLKDPNLSKHEKDSLRKIAQSYTERKSLNFTNVKINKQKPKPQFYDVSNWSVSYAFNEQYSKNINTVYNQQKSYRGALAYNFNNQPKNISPFSKVKLFKAPIFTLLRDFNFYYAPQQFSFISDMDRQYNEVQLRNINDVNLEIPTTYNKSFSWNRSYDLKFDLTKQLKFDFTAANTSFIDEPIQYGQRVNKQYETEYSHWKDSVFKNIMDLGRNIQYHHSWNLNYNIPINKIPIFNWISGSVRYNGTYDWMTGPKTADTIRLGNTIKNSNTTQYNGQLNLVNLYNKVGFLKKINQKYSKNKKNKKQEKKTEKVYYPEQNAPPKFVEFKANTPRSIQHKLLTEDVEIKVFDTSGVEIKGKLQIMNENRVTFTTEKDYKKAKIQITGNREVKDNIFVIIAEQTARILMAVKNVSVSYSITEGTVLPGYMQRTELLGMESANGRMAPGFPFIFGMQDKDFGRRAANEYGWLTDDTLMNSPYMMNTSRNLNLRSSIEPLPDLRIDLTASRSESWNLNEYYRYNSSTGQWDANSNMLTGNFTMSWITWKTTFKKINMDNYSSEVYDNFRNYRMDIALRLAGERVNHQNANSPYVYDPTIRDTLGYPNGYGPTSQDVLVPAFLAAYSGTNPNKITLSKFPSALSIKPNWRITYDGLAKIKFFKRYLKTMTIDHAYRCTYSVGSYTTNLYYYNKGDGMNYVRDNLQESANAPYNFLPEREATGISISEMLSPLISIDMTWVNSLITKVEIKKSRNLSLSFANNQLTEVMSDEYIFGTGYRIKDVKLIINKKKEISSDLNLRGDFSIRNNLTVIRQLEGEVNQPTTGQKIVTLKLSADYMLGTNFSLKFFVDRIVNAPKVSISYRTSNTNVGFSVRFSLAQ